MISIYALTNSLDLRLDNHTDSELKVLRLCSRGCLLLQVFIGGLCQTAASTRGEYGPSSYLESLRPTNPEWFGV